MRLLTVLAVTLALASRAGAAEFTESEQAALDRGRPVAAVSVEPDAASGLIRAAIDVAAPPEVVFAVITDCALAPKMVASLKSCRVLERDPAGHWDVREQVSKMTFVPSVRNVFRSDYDPPGHVRFHRIDGDLKVFEGEWRIEPHGTGSRVIYENRASLPFRVPGYLARIALRIDVRQALLALRRESLARIG